MGTNQFQEQTEEGAAQAQSVTCYYERVKNTSRGEAGVLVFVRVSLAEIEHQNQGQLGDTGSTSITLPHHSPF